MNVSVIVASFGSEAWREHGTHAALSVVCADEVIHLHEDVGPVSRIRNRIAQGASGNWLGFLDADDMLAPGYLPAMHEACAHPGPPVVLLVPRVSYDGAPPVFPNGGGTRSLIEINWAVIGTLIPAALFHELGGFRAQDEPYEDWSLWLRATAAGAQLVPVPGAVYNASVRPESAHRTRNPKRRRQLAETYQRIRAELAPAFA